MESNVDIFIYSYGYSYGYRYGYIYIYIYFFWKEIYGLLQEYTLNDIGIPDMIQGMFLKGLAGSLGGSRVGGSGAGSLV